MKVKYAHFRYTEEGCRLHEAHPVETLRRLGLRPAAKGGYTIASLYDDDGTLLARGMALCSTADNFCRARGRQIAEGRARKSLQLQEVAA